MKPCIAGLLVALCLVPMAAQTSAQKKKSTSRRKRAAVITPEQSCRTFVQKFYSWYTSKPIQENHDVTADHLARRVHPDYFAPAIKKALEADELAASKSPDEVVGLDGDPFLNAQETADRYYAGLATIEDGVCKVPIFGVNRPPNPPTEKHLKHLPEVVALLKNESSKWVFQDFVYDEKETLLSVLADLARDRDKAKAEANNPKKSDDTKPDAPKPDAPKPDQTADPKK